MLPGFRFICGAVLAIMLLMAFGLAVMVRVAHLANPVDPSRSVAYSDVNDGNGRWPDTVGAIGRVAPRAGGTESPHRQTTTTEPMPAPAGPEAVVDGKWLSAPDAERPAETSPTKATSQQITVVAPVIADPSETSEVRATGTDEAEDAAADMADEEIASAPMVEPPPLATVIARMPATEVRDISAGQATDVRAMEFTRDPAVADNTGVKETASIPAKDVAGVAARREGLPAAEIRPVRAPRDGVASMPPPAETAALERDGDSKAAGMADGGRSSMGGPLAPARAELPPAAPQTATADRTKRATKVANVARKAEPVAAETTESKPAVTTTKRKRVHRAKSKPRRYTRRGFILPTARTGYPISANGRLFR